MLRSGLAIPLRIASLVEVRYAERDRAPLIFARSRQPVAALLPVLTNDLLRFIFGA